VARELRSHLSEVSRLRLAAEANADGAAVREALRRWQSARLASAYPDLLGSPRFGAAARFFLDDLYGPKNFTRRDAEITKIVPALTRMLPAPALAVIARALELDALSEQLDAAMSTLLGPGRIDAQRYAAAYRSAGTRALRERQIALIVEVGSGLNELVRLPLLGTTLAMMRGPAALTGLAALHDFLERGFRAFRQMGDASEFLATIQSRESSLLERLYAGDPEPFGQWARDASHTA
jgi:hypothetical protein